jgi:uncharacterized protein YjiS (DUF1127 family)
MTTIATAPAAVRSARPLDRLVRMAGHLVRAAVRRRRVARDLQHLSRADDRLLADIGLERWMLHDAIATGRLPQRRPDHDGIR